MSKSVRQLASEADRRRRVCKRCKYLGICTPNVSEVCTKAFAEGFIKGYNEHKNKNI